MSKRELAIAFILVMGVLAPLIDIPEAKAITLFPQDQTIDIVDTWDDSWITELGRHFDSPLVQILDPNQDLVSYLIFREVEINFWEPLTNATLSLYTTSNQSFDRDSSVTIYGMKVDELQTISVGASFVLSVPYTTAHVNYNTSLFSGSAWHDIDVTKIVKELITAHNWDGDGVTGTETGDAIGFVILGAKGSDPRWFQDYRSYPPKSADLRIRWNHQPPLNDPPDDYEYIEDYRNHSIWAKVIYEYPPGPIEYAFTQGSGAPFNASYDTVHSVPATPITIKEDARLGQYSNAQRKLIRLSDGTLYSVYTLSSTPPQVYIKNSSDNGQTWAGETNLSVTTHQQQEPSIAVDSNDVIHVVWSGLHDDFLPTDFQIWYINYTDSWSKPLRISNYTGMENYLQEKPCISIDANNSLYVAWKGLATGFTNYNQIWFSNYTDSWSYPLRISTYAGMDGGYQNYPNIAIDANNTIHVVWDGKITTVSIIWYRKYDTSWQPVEYIVADAPRNNLVPVIAVDPDDNLHVTWAGKTVALPTNNNILYMNYTDSWSTPLRISTYTGMQNYDQLWPSIYIDADSSIHIVWDGKATGYTLWEVVWYAKKGDSWITPEVLQPIGENTNPNLRWSRFPAYEDYIYFITDENGTITETDCVDVECVQDIIDDIEGDDPMDPEPSGWEDAPVYVSRFRMRLYFLIIGYGCVWGPIWFFCWKRPTGYYIAGAFITMLIGFGLLIGIPYV